MQENPFAFAALTFFGLPMNKITKNDFKFWEHADFKNMKPVGKTIPPHGARAKRMPGLSTAWLWQRRGACRGEAQRSRFIPAVSCLVGVEGLRRYHTETMQERQTECTTKDHTPSPTQLQGPGSNEPSSRQVVR